MPSVSSVRAGVHNRWWLAAATAPSLATTTTTAGHHGYRSATTAVLAATVPLTVVATIAVAVNHSSRICMDLCCGAPPMCLVKCPMKLLVFSAWLLFMWRQHASISQGWICSDDCMCCHIDIEVADQTLYLTQLLYTDTGLIRPTYDSRGLPWQPKF